MKTILILAGFFSLTLLHADESLQKLALKHGLKPMSHVYTLSTHPEVMIDLGKKLFFDKSLSLKGDISCASCHSTKHGGADGRPTAIGYKGQSNPHHLNTPTVLNTAFSKHYFWDGRSVTLSDQAKGPLQAPFEMASNPKLIEKRIAQTFAYPQQFKKAFGDSNITFERTVEAISAYEDTLVTRGRYDRFLEGNLTALDENEQAGLNLFIQKGCIGCHNGIGLGGQEMRKFPLLHHPIWSMAKQKKINELREKYLSFLAMPSSNSISRHDALTQTIGVEDTELLRLGYFEHYNQQDSDRVIIGKGCFECHIDKTFRVENAILKQTAFAFENKGGFLGKEKPSRYFRVPLLRNVVRTAPYFHNGNVATLKEAVQIMVKYQSRSSVTPQQLEQLIAFLKAVDAPISD
jgi:cytochrome c peroxidase